jgi:hypothetical protein
LRYSIKVSGSGDIMMDRIVTLFLGYFIALGLEELLSERNFGYHDEN